jgi:hypothetical protein
MVHEANEIEGSTIRTSNGSRMNCSMMIAFASSSDGRMSAGMVHSYGITSRDKQEDDISTVSLV